MWEQLKLSVLAWPRPVKRSAALTVDIMLCALAVRLAFYLRLEIWYGWERAQLLAAMISVIIAAPLFVVSGLYRAIFRYGGNRLLRSVVVTCLLYGALYAFALTFWGIGGIPRSIGVLQPVLLLLLIGLSRIAASWWLGESYARARKHHGRRIVAIYGAGSAGRQLYQALEQSRMEVCAFIDDNPTLHGQVLLGKMVYSGSNLSSLINRHAPTEILLALPSASRRRRREIIEELRPLGLEVRTLPGVTQLAEGKVVAQELHNLDIDDLLGREPVEPDELMLAAKIKGRCLVVTGAGGSIGSELCRQILAREPASLLLIEHSEHALYAIHRELELRSRSLALPVRIVPLLASVCDGERIQGIFKAWQPQTIYHAAAYKHVPLVEYNPAEGVWNNTFGTLTVALAAIAAGVSDLVFISTDKAVRPTNVMGSSKRLAELCLQALAANGVATRLSMVRFGNVLGSSGSVVPLFREQMLRGGPITLTDPDVFRYFMTIPEASQLVIQAGAMAKGGEVFVLDMGAPVRIMDLARRMVEQSGLTVSDAANPDGDIAFEIVGLRPGEKLHEELLIGNDPSPTGHPGIMMAREHFIAWGELELELTRLRRAVEASDIAGVLKLLGRLVVEYRPAADVHDLVFRQNVEAIR